MCIFSVGINSYCYLVSNRGQLFLPEAFIIKSVLTHFVHVADSFRTCIRGAAHHV